MIKGIFVASLTNEIIISNVLLLHRYFSLLGTRFRYCTIRELDDYGGKFCVGKLIFLLNCWDSYALEW